MPKKDVRDPEFRRAFWTMIANLPEPARSELRLFYVTGSKGEEKEPLLRITTSTVDQKDFRELDVRLKSDLTPDALDVLKAIKEADIREGNEKGFMWRAIEQVVKNPESEYSLNVWTRVIEALRARMSSPPKPVPAYSSPTWEKFAFSLDRLRDASPEELKPKYDEAWKALSENLTKVRKVRYIKMEDFSLSHVDKNAWELVWEGKVVPSTSVLVSEESSPTGNLVQATPKNVQAALRWPVPPHCVVLEGVPGTGKTFRLKDVRKAAALDGSTIVGDGSGRFAVTLHPATAYEDFVEGLRPGNARTVTERIQEDWGKDRAGVNKSPVVGRRSRTAFEEDQRKGFFFQDGKPTDASKLENKGKPKPGPVATFSLHDGFFLSVCIEAAHYPTCEFAVLLDELNRCNIPKVMGDLLTTLESSKRATWRSKKNLERRCWDASAQDGFWDISEAQVVSLPYSQRLFFVPDNVYVIATMNTTDRSVAPMDAALRRRFAFERVWPIGFEPSAVGAAERKGTDEEQAAAATETMLSKLGCPDKDLIRPSVEAWIALNTRLQKFGDDAMLGHSYLFDLVRDLGVSYDSAAPSAAPSAAQGRIIEHHWNKHIFPQLVDSLLSNDLIDRVFPKEGTPAKDSSDSLPELGLKSTGNWALRWSLRGVGLMRVPTITVSVKDETSAEGVETKTGNEAET